MSSAAFLPFSDDQERQAAIDPGRSFTVQAPAGSGKTELLIQRFLSLLAIAEKPETIVAITFTRKAAAEMRERILRSLREAVANSPIERPHAERTRVLALSVLARDHKHGWDLLGSPARLRVETIDALCVSITGAMPWLARFGAMPRIQDDNSETYDEAARRTILEIDSNEEFLEALTDLLRHLKNDAPTLRGLIANMLSQRDQWMQLVFSGIEEDRELLESTLERVAHKYFSRMNDLIPPAARTEWMALAGLTEWPGRDQRAEWSKLRDGVLTKGKEWRKRGVPRVLIEDLKRVDGLQKALTDLSHVPPTRYDDAQWKILQGLLVVLRRAAAQLQHVFRERGVVDFTEISQAAERALRESGNPTELAFRLDSRIDHLLVDEFQDTSRAQFRLIETLIAGWEPGDGRTILLVGDPMQSIYRFRQAEVGLFLHVREHGIGNLRPDSLSLSANFRTSPTLLERINQVCQDIFPKLNEENIETGRISFKRCYSSVEDDVCEWKVHPIASAREEAEHVVELVRAARLRNPKETVAILVRARSHCSAIIAALKDAGIAFQAVDVDSLSERPVVQDLLALTRALLHPGDRISWLAILRAPWCGLRLADLEVIAQSGIGRIMWMAMADLTGLSEDGQRRASRLRDVLFEAFAQRSRWPLRQWVERVWVRLGGPACLEGDERQLQDASDFLDLLEREQEGCDLRDFDRFPELVGKLYSRPDPRASATLQLMTIHQAKGLEFDTVILPGLERTTGNSDAQPLLLFHEWQGENGPERVLGPIRPTGAEADPIYGYVQKLEREKEDHERLRLFYVAATRAKRRLYLFGQLKYRKGDGSAYAKSGSMLGDIVKALTPEETAPVTASARHGAGSSAPRAGLLRRLPGAWVLPDLPAPVVWDGAGPARTVPHDPTFEWVGETLRILGTVVHALLQRMSGNDRRIPDLKHIRAALGHAGLSAEEIPKAAERVREALERTLESTRGQWILEGHDHADSEYAVTGVVDGEIMRGQVDRTFVDNEGTRWIIDFKTSVHEGTDLEGFLDEQQRRYSDQMSRYGRILASLGNPVRLGLYFPLLDGWREWALATINDGPADHGKPSSR